MIFLQIIVLNTMLFFLNIYTCNKYDYVAAIILSTYEETTKKNNEEKKRVAEEEKIKQKVNNAIVLTKKGKITKEKFYQELNRLLIQSINSKSLKFVRRIINLGATNIPQAYQLIVNRNEPAEDELKQYFENQVETYKSIEFILKKNLPNLPAVLIPIIMSYYMNCGFAKIIIKKNKWCIIS